MKAVRLSASFIKVSISLSLSPSLSLSLSFSLSLSSLSFSCTPRIRPSLPPPPSLLPLRVHFLSGILFSHTPHSIARALTLTHSQVSGAWGRRQLICIRRHCKTKSSEFAKLFMVGTCVCAVYTRQFGHDLSMMLYACVYVCILENLFMTSLLHTCPIHPPKKKHVLSHIQYVHK
jgi:hypothetical protein